VAAADALLRVDEVAGLRPEVVLRLGSPWASRVLATWLGRLGPSVEQVLVDPYGRWADPERSAATIVRCAGAALCRAVAAAAGTDIAAGTSGREWAEAWSLAEAAAQAAIDRTLSGHPEVTEPGVARTLVDVLPAGASLFVSSSMPVRDVEWFGRPRRDLRVLANRGANGIDGIVSTALGVAAAGALGVAAAGRGPVAALVGDLAFVYDAGALLWAVDRGVDLVIVVVDNNGGGIFSFLPQAAALPPARFEQLWGTPHGIDLAALAAAYRVPVSRVDRADQVGPAVSAAVAGGGVRVVHVRTDREANVAMHAEIGTAVAAAVPAGLATPNRGGSS
jgi:2-succinyl-5-enolpyruvyl-6-hydroxy-3-cyclohexene-1-carboxylate synthase